MSTLPTLPCKSASRALLVLALSAFATAGWALPVEVGQPTYYTNSYIADDRGKDQPNYVISRVVEGWNGQGSSGVAVHQPRPNQVNATVASGAASATELKSLANATGPVGYRDTQTPFVVARNRSESTRYWEFREPGRTTTTYSPLVMQFEGTIRGMSVHELLQTATSRLSFGLDLIDASNNLLGNIFTVSADLDFTPLATTLWSLTANATGTATHTGWDNSLFVKRASPSPVDYIFDFDWLANMTSQYTVPTNQKVGLRWFLETEGMFEGVLVFSADIGVDASNTANFDSNVSSTNLRPGASATEVLSVPAAFASVPEPTSLALLLGGLVGLGGLRRQQTQAER